MTQEDRANPLATVLAGNADIDTLPSPAAVPDVRVLPEAEGAGHLRTLGRLPAAANRKTRLTGLFRAGWPNASWRRPRARRRFPTAREPVVRFATFHSGTQPAANDGADPHG